MMPANSPVDEAIRRIRQFIGGGELEKAVEQAKNLTADGPRELANEVIGLSGRVAHMNKLARKGTQTAAETDATRAKIASDLTELLDDMAQKLAPTAAPVPAPTAPATVFAGTEAVAFEKILGVNNLKQVAWIEEGVKACRAVCRLLTPEGYGTGFLIGRRTLMTNNHVINSAEMANGTKAEFNYQYQFAAEGNTTDTVRYGLDPETLFRTSAALDYTVVAVKPDPAKPLLELWGVLHLNPNAEPIPTEHVVIVQHPNAGPKQIVLTANAVLQVKPPLLHYSTDTMPGSSGAPVFNDLWQVIAIHHAEGPQVKLAGGSIRYSNEGMLMSAIKPDLGNDWPSDS